MAGKGASIDVVICTFNNAPLLERTLASLANQQTPSTLRWSVLVVDNASTDRTAEVVEAFSGSERIPRLRRVYEPRQGLVAARIRGVSETVAPWIAFVDDDCLLDATWMANASAFIESHETCGGFGGIVRLEFEAPPPDYVRRYGYSYAEQEHGDLECQREWLVGAGLVLNRDALQRSGWMEKQHLGDRKGNLLLSGGDMEMVLRIRAAGFTLWYTPHCLIRHYIQTRRTRFDYLARINFGLGVSQTWCDLLVCSRPYHRYIAGALFAAGMEYLKAARQVPRIVSGSRSMADLRVRLGFAAGRLAGLLQILRLSRGVRLGVLGCARPGIAGGAMNREPAIRHIALLHWGDLIEDFLDEINVTLEQFREEMTGGWMFGYIRALESAGISTTLFCVSARVWRIESWKHRPTGAAICVLPASRFYRRLLRFGVTSAVWKNKKTPAKGRIAWHANRLLQDLLPYLATPIGTLRREIKKRQCQAILCQEYEHARFDLSVLAGTLSGVPVFASFQGGDTRFSRFERLFRRMAIGKCAGLIVGSSRERDRVRNWYGVPDQRVAGIFNPLDIAMWYPEDRRTARTVLQLPENALLIVWHGRIDLLRKGLDVLIEAWDQLTRIRPRMDGYLVLVGDGPDSAILRRLIETRKMARIIWRNEYVLDRSVMRRYLSAGDVYVFTSRHEGFPVAPLEAMACGLPVVATDCVGIRDILTSDSGAGVVVPLEDSASLAQALAGLLDDQERRCEMGRKARKLIEENFGLTVVGDRLREFLAAPPGGISKTRTGPGNRQGSCG